MSDDDSKAIVNVAAKAMARNNGSSGMALAMAIANGKATAATDRNINIVKSSIVELNYSVT